MILDIEESGSWNDSSDPDARAFHAKDHEEYEAAIRDGKANERRERQAVLAERARNALKQHSACLRIAKTPYDTVKCLDELSKTYVWPFKPKDASIYLRSKYYLWRIGPVKNA